MGEYLSSSLAAVTNNRPTEENCTTGGRFTVLPFYSAPIMGRDDDNVCLREEEMANIRMGDCDVAETEFV